VRYLEENAGGSTSSSPTRTSGASTRSRRSGSRRATRYADMSSIDS
jgi:hypothetical protein